MCMYMMSYPDESTDQASVKVKSEVGEEDGETQHRKRRSSLGEKRHRRRSSTDPNESK